MDRAELLYRQVHPTWIDDGQPSSQAFRPTKKDEGMLSVALASLTTAEGAFYCHTQVLGLASGGTWGVSVGEASALELDCLPDPTEADPAHGVVDFSGLGRKAAEAKARVLRAKALARGCLHQP
jgi:hypothetical protein